MNKNSISNELFARACAVIPGGVNSPVRAFRSVGGTPIIITRGEGSRLIDEDSNEYIDYVGSWGPMILGHANATVCNAISDALKNGISFGAPTRSEIEIAELLTSIIPGLDLIRMVNSGTEATMSAVRVARAFTGRDYIIKFNGCYHGHADTLLVAAGSGVATCGISGSLGIPDAVSKLTLSIEFNDADLLEQTIEAVGAERIAAIIVEPVAGNMGLVLPLPGYLQKLRSLCSENGIMLIFDEVMSGFRVARGGAAEKFGITPDLYTFGKIIGAGMPVGAFGGRRDVMELLAPCGNVYQAGTLSGNPIAMAAGLAQLRVLLEQNPYPQLQELAKRWAVGMTKAADDAGIPLVTSYCGAMLGLFFSDKTVTCYAQAKQTNTALFAKFFHKMLLEGIYLAPSPFEALFLSTAHTTDDIDQTIESARKVFASLNTVSKN